MFMSGYGVERIGETEEGLVAGVDFFATILEMMDFDLPGGYNNSYSLKEVLSDNNATTQWYNYSEQSEAADFERAIRNEQFKLLIYTDSVGAVVSEEFYDLINDPFEVDELIGMGLNMNQQLNYDDLKTEADSIYLSWSCRDPVSYTHLTLPTICSV